MLYVGGITLETVTKLPSYLYVLVARVTDTSDLHGWCWYSFFHLIRSQHFAFYKVEICNSMWTAFQWCLLILQNYIERNNMGAPIPWPAPHQNAISTWTSTSRLDSASRAQILKLPRGYNFSPLQISILSCSSLLSSLILCTCIF